MWDGTNCVSDTGGLLGNCHHGYDFEDDDTSPLPTTSAHGTHVAGTIAAVKGNNRGVAGVAPKAKIMAIKSSLTTANIIQSINFAKYNGAKVINASWGGSGSALANDQALISAIAAFPGVFVAAAGNGGIDNIGDNNELVHFYPADYTLSNIISVAATNQTDGLASFSNYGTTSVDVGAPGVSIYSTFSLETTLLNETFQSLTVPNIPV